MPPPMSSASPSSAQSGSRRRFGPPRPVADRGRRALAAAKPVVERPDVTEHRCRAATEREPGPGNPGVDADELEAYKWFYLAGQLGIEPAHEAMRVLSRVRAELSRRTAMKAHSMMMADNSSVAMA